MNKRKPMDRSTLIGLMGMLVGVTIILSIALAVTAAGNGTTIETRTLTLATSTNMVTTSNANVIAIQDCVYVFKHGNSSIAFYYTNATSLTNLGPNGVNPGFIYYEIKCPVNK